MNWILVLLLLIYGCVPVDSTPAPVVDNGRTDIVYMGDSNCDENGNVIPWQVAGISGDCVAGRALLSVNYMHPNMKLTFIAMGTNDAAYGYNPRHYEDRLWYLMSLTSGDVYCVLPTTAYNFTDYDVKPFRDAMRRVCSNIIDPVLIGANIFYGDGKHYTDEGNQILGDYVKGIVDSYENT